VPAGGWQLAKFAGKFMTKYIWIPGKQALSLAAFDKENMFQQNIKSSQPLRVAPRSVVRRLPLREERSEGVNIRAI
jgi:hypothetical protein